MYLELLALYACSYLAGSIPTSNLIAKLAKGIDLREYGSGNVGGSNLARQLGRRWIPLLVLVELAVKGLSPFAMALLLVGNPVELSTRSLCLFLGAPLLALVGNNWSVFLRFQGGRGLMVVCGMVAALAPLLFLATMLVYLAGWRITRSSAVWALLAVALLPALALAPGGLLVVGWSGLVNLLVGGSQEPAPDGYPAVISWFSACILGIVLVKRVVSNSLEFPEGVPRRRVIFNRLIRDRDVDDRSEWVSRIPH